MMCIGLGIGSCLVIQAFRQNTLNQEAEVNLWMPPPDFQEEHLIGLWERIPPSEYSIESIDLRPDHTFTQIYTNTTDIKTTYTKTGEWFIEKRPSGCVYLHLSGGAQLGRNPYFGEAPWSFWDECEEKNIELDKKLILVIGQEPHGLDIGLNYLRTSAEGSYSWFVHQGP